MRAELTRRKFLISAMAAGLASGSAALLTRGEGAAGYIWRGAALGGEARVTLFGSDPQVARAALAAVANEIERMENIFSLYRPTSELSRLNRDGSLTDPSRDMLELLGSALRWRAKTEGAFDPTVQPLWLAAAKGATIAPEIMTTARSAVYIAPQAITLTSGAALTLNGIAQGRIADRATEILAAHGFNDVIIDAGELRLPGKAPRSVGIPAANAAVTIAEIAVATSEPKAFVFDARTYRHHLIDPRTGESPRHWESVSVFAPTAEKADALSTAFAVLPRDAVASLASTIGDVAVIASDSGGRTWRFGDMSLTGQRGVQS
jgi:thiamine biosynthesis lipoprotein